MRADRTLTPNDLFPADARAPRVAASVLSLLDELGYSVADFIVTEEAQSDLAREIGVLGGLLRMRCRSTGEERLYSTGRGSAWMASVLGDLDDGHFRRARRHAGAAGHDGSRHGRHAQHGQADFADTTPHVRLPDDELDGIGPRTRQGASPYTTGRPAFQSGYSAF